MLWILSFAMFGNGEPLLSAGVEYKTEAECVRVAEKIGPLLGRDPYGVVAICIKPTHDGVINPSGTWLKLYGPSPSEEGK